MTDEGYEFISLRKLLKLFGREKTEQMLNEFESIHGDSSPAGFLHEDAISMELRDVSRTHLAISDSSEIIGFFTIGIKSMDMAEDNSLSNSAIKKMNVDPATGFAQAYILGQLCRSCKSPRGFGKVLLDRVLRKIWPSYVNLGCRVIRLDCEDVLVEYYKKQGFREVGKDPNTNLMKMIAFVDGNTRTLR